MSWAQLSIAIAGGLSLTSVGKAKFNPKNFRGTLKQLKLAGIDDLASIQGGLRSANKTLKNAYKRWRARVAAKNLTIPNKTDLLKLGDATGKGTFTKAGHSLSKHAAGKRAGSSKFPDPKGSPTNYNSVARKTLDDVLSDPAKVVKIRPGRPGEILLQIHRLDGSGVIFKYKGSTWEFSHFAENLF